MNMCISFRNRKMFEVGPKNCLNGLKTLGWTVVIILEGEDFEDVDPDLASQSS